MNWKTLLCNNIKVIVALSIVLVGCIFLNRLESVYSSFMTVNKQKVNDVFYQKDLAQFNGVQNKKLYLALLGSIFDVTKGKRHYGRGAPYNYFIGK